MWASSSAPSSRAQRGKPPPPFHERRPPLMISPLCKNYLRAFFSPVMLKCLSGSKLSITKGRLFIPFFKYLFLPTSNYYLVSLGYFTNVLSFVDGSLCEWLFWIMEPCQEIKESDGTSGQSQCCWATKSSTKVDKSSTKAIVGCLNKAITQEKKK